MTRVVDQYGGVNLAQGMPNFPPPRALIEAAHRAHRRRLPSVRDHLGGAELRAAPSPRSTGGSTAWTSIPTGTSPCAAAPPRRCWPTLLAVLNPGDEVIIFEPFYENYGPGCIISGAVPIWVPLDPPDFSFDPDRLARAVTPRTRAIVFNSPNNPSGKVFSRRRAAGHRRPLPASTTCSPSPTRSTSTSSTTASGHTPIATLARHGRAHHHHLRRLQVVLGDGLAGGLGGGAARDQRRHPPRPRLHHGGRPASAAGGRAVTALGLPDSYYAELRDGVSGAPRSAVRGRSSGRASWRGSRAARTTSSPRPPTSSRR